MQGFTKQGSVEVPTYGTSTRRNVRRRQMGGAAMRAVVFLLTLLVVAIVVVWGISSRRQADAQLSQETHDLAIPSVMVVHPKPAPPMQEIILPGNMQPYISAPICARTSGYLKKWYVDIGAHVKSGQLLAEIDAPEVDQQLQQAKADLANSQANLQLAQITATRYTDLMKTDSVAQQDVDNAKGNLDARKAALESSQSNVKRLEDEQAFEKIYAPFEGVITARNTDIGALIDSGASGGTTRELFNISAVNRLRVYVNVPQVYSPQIKEGLRADLVLTEYPGRKFEGMLVRNSGSIDATSRTLLTEVDVDNRSGELKPGSYVEVHLRLPSPVTTFMLPVNAVIFKSAGLQVATVKDGKTIALITVTPGRDFGNDMEIVSGVQESDSIVINPPDSLANGQPVQLAQVQPVSEGKK
jgi:RND family efflux transporter MFP subunit